MPRRKKGSGHESAKSGFISKGKPQQRNAANARERSRMRVLSKAFCTLKTTLPWVPADTKLSKLDTLRLASSYIAHLKKTLAAEDQYVDSNDSNCHPAMTLTWPFGFNRPTSILEGNGSASLDGRGSDAEEESNSGCWDPGSPTKDCIHLDNSDLLLNPKHHAQLQLQESSYKCHVPEDISSNNNNLSYNFHHHHHHHQNVSYFQGDIMPIN